jgi:hypothetical protein
MANCTEFHRLKTYSDSCGDGVRIQQEITRKIAERLEVEKEKFFEAKLREKDFHFPSTQEAMRWCVDNCHIETDITRHRYMSVVLTISGEVLFSFKDEATVSYQDGKLIATWGE